MTETIAQPCPSSESKDEALVSRNLPRQTVDFYKEATVPGRRHLRYHLCISWGPDPDRSYYHKNFTPYFQTTVWWAVPEPRYEDGWRTVDKETDRAVLLQLWPEHLRAFQFHDCTAAGPVNYIKNTLYYAGVRDCFGTEPGVQRRASTGQLLWFFENAEKLDTVASDVKPPPFRWEWEPRLVDREELWGPNKGIPAGGMQRDEQGNHIWRLPGASRRAPEIRSKTKPEALVFEYQPMLGVGKAREFDEARRCAIWPDATDAELSVPAEQLTAALEARLPKLQRDLKALIESYGMTY